MKKSEKKIIVFDLDGTLVNSMERLTDIGEEVLSKYFQIPAQEARRLYMVTSGLAFPDQLRSLYPAEESKRSKASRDFARKKRAGYFDEKTFPDTHETIRYLKENGYKVIISSNSEQELVEQLVEQLGIACDQALGFRDDFKKGQPHFQFILKQWGGDKKDLVFIGDSIKDGERALENGVDFIGLEGLFKRGEFQEHFPGVPVISKLAELKEIF